MTISKIVFVVAGLAVSQLGWGQSSAAAQHGILGYLDVKTGTFKPLPTASTESEQPAAVVAPTTGKLVFNFTINVASQLASSDVINCEAGAIIIEISSSASNTINEQAAAVAKRSGSKATCSVTLPYSWPLTSASTDTVQLSYSITATAAAGGAVRISEQTIATIKVPSSGATTTYNLTPTI